MVSNFIVDIVAFLVRSSRVRTMDMFNSERAVSRQAIEVSLLGRQLLESPIVSLHDHTFDVEKSLGAHDIS